MLLNNPVPLQRAHQLAWLRNWGGALTLGAGVYLALYWVWLFTLAETTGYQTLISNVSYILVGLAAFGAAWHAARHPALDQHTRRALCILTLALLLYTIINVLWLYYEDILGQEVAGSWVDLVNLMFFPTMLWSILSFPTAKRTHTERLTLWLDIGTVLLGGGMVVWYFILRPTAMAEYTTMFEYGIALAYPMADMLVLFGLITLALRRPQLHNRSALAVLAVALLIHTIADLGYIYLLLRDSYTTGTLLDGFWLSAVFLFALSAQLQYRDAVGAVILPTADQRTSQPFKLLPYAAVIVGYGLLLVVAQDQLNTALGGLIIGAVLLTTLVVARQAVAERENTHLQAEHAAHQSEARFRSLVQQSSDVITVIGRDGTVQYQTPSAERVFGYTLAATSETSLLDCLHPDDVPQAHLLLAGLAQRLGMGAPVEWRVRHHDGSWLHVEALGNNLLDDPNVQGIVVTLRDISERRAREAAESASRAKSTFLSTISHELRTPLSAIIGYSEFLTLRLHDEKQDHFMPDVEKILAAGRQLLGLINDVLDLSKIEAGKMDVHRDTIDVRDLVTEAVATAMPLALRNQNTLDIVCPDDIGTITSDSTKTRQVLLNLLSNAAKFTHNGSIELCIARELRDGVPWISFAVSDTGIGVQAEQIPRLFQMFEQADASTTRRYGGTGLGLALSQRFCELLGGSISIISKLGSGSTFTLHLPATMPISMAQFLLVDTPTVSAGAPRSIVLPEHPNSLHVSAASAALLPAEYGNLLLVIDDDPVACELITRCFQGGDVRVEVARDGLEGLRLAQALLPDVITLDLMMPGLSGWSVLSALKSSDTLAHIPVIMLTIVDDLTTGMLLGAADYLVKPVDPARLVECVHRHRAVLPAVGPIGAYQALVVDDDPAMRDLFGKVLAADGWRVHMAADGPAALAQVAASLPDVIVLDLMMPMMDGIEVVAALRADARTEAIPIIIVTAKDVTPEEQQQLDGQVARVLQKGATMCDDVLHEVRSLVHVVIAQHKETTGEVSAENIAG